jgi:ribA/ribD-fused uncharacterized protein
MIHEFDGRYSFLSNMYLCAVEYEGITYPSAEHAYQASKTRKLGVRCQISAMAHPWQAKKFGGTVMIRAGWEKNRLDIMFQILEEKFRSPNLRSALMATYPEELVEGNYWGDTFWGVFGGKGQNHLGQILMRVRQQAIDDSELRERTRMSQEP